jgi:hypothetical protein
MKSYFLDRAVEWRLIADELRAHGAPEDDPALRVWREAAWCHVLLRAGREQAAFDCLRRLVRVVTGQPAPEQTSPVALFVRLRAAVSARYPAAFDQLAPC